MTRLIAENDKMEHLTDSCQFVFASLLNGSQVL